MLSETVKLKQIKDKEITTKRVFSKDDKKIKASSKTQIIIYAALICLIFAYLAYDIFFAKTKAQQKAAILNEQADSMNVKAVQKLKDIDNASQTQKQQLKKLKNIVKEN